MTDAPPSNIPLEQALLGAILVNNDAMDNLGTLSPEHFYDPVHGRIFEACQKLIDRGQKANPITLKTYFENDPQLDEVSGVAYFADLAASAVTIINAGRYAKEIQNLAIRRELIVVAAEIGEDAELSQPGEDGADVLERAEAKLHGMNNPAATRITTAGVVAGRVLEHAEAAWKGKTTGGITTGLIDLDERLGGLHPSRLYIVGARPGVGKSALAGGIAFAAATQAPVAFFSLEMDATELVQRETAMRAGVEVDRVIKGHISQDEFNRLYDARLALEVEPHQVWIDDTARSRIATIRRESRKLQRRKGLGLIVVDYLQLIQAPKGFRADNRVAVLTEITADLKALAKELKVPVLALSQLSRNLENREDKRPMMADLRESGSIEQDADVVMFLYRHEYYLERQEPDMSEDVVKHEEWVEHMKRVAGLAELNIAKNRQGRTGKIDLTFDGPLVKFNSLVQQRYMEVV